MWDYVVTRTEIYYIGSHGWSIMISCLFNDSMIVAHCKNGNDLLIWTNIPLIVLIDSLYIWCKKVKRTELHRKFSLFFARNLTLSKTTSKKWGRGDFYNCSVVVYNVDWGKRSHFTIVENFYWWKHALSLGQWPSLDMKWWERRKEHE